MRFEWLRGLLLASCAVSAACKPDPMCTAPGGYYRVHWLHVPSDCLPAKRLQELPLDFGKSCARVGRLAGDQCSIHVQTSMAFSSGTEGDTECA